ncbi:MAG: pilus assembly protein PilM, partial [Puniceicoccales bacterium]|nr:pilus assembly protein PilM [Puniceicoccales bacterium]
MSLANSIIVNCGATHVSASVFSAAGGQLRLEKFLVRSLDYNYANEEEWLGALGRPLRSIVSNLHLSGPSTVIVPGYRLLTKNIKVPQVEQSRQRQIIAFEAQNSLPDAADMVWDSQIISTDGVETEVALFAHRSSDANRFTEAVYASGLTPSVVDAATLLDYQAYRLAHPEITEDVLLANVGARSTNLTFVSQNAFSIQNISIGGNLLTQMLAESLGKTFPAAEELKTQFFTDQIPHNESDPLARTLTTGAQSFGRRLSQEILRRIVNYKRQNQGRAPSALLLSGRASLLPGLAAHLSESLNIAVDYFDPTESLHIGPHVQKDLLDSFRFQMSETVGCAARLVLPDAVGVDLLPVEISKRIAFEKKRPAFIVAALFFAIAPWLPVGIPSDSIPKSIQKDSPKYNFLQNLLLPSNKKLVVQTKARQAEYKRIDTLQRDIRKVRDDTAAVASRTTALAQIAGAKDEWNGLLSAVQDAILNDKEDSNNHVWIESVSILRKPRPVAAVRAPSGQDAAQTPASPAASAVQVTFTVSALMDQIAPDSGYNSGLVNAKFTKVFDALKKIPFAESVEQRSAGPDKPNLPKRTFVLTINPA